jgi:hypothetical protein
VALRYKKVDAPQKAYDATSNPLLSQKTLLWVGGGVAAFLLLRYLMKKAGPPEAVLTPSQAMVKKDIADGKLVFVDGRWQRKLMPKAPIKEPVALAGGILAGKRGLGSL